jgi:branched-chain amino acid aminotransferase
MRDQGVAVREERYSIDQWEADAKSGRLREAFACGTAAVVTPIGAVRGSSLDFRIGNGGPGVLTGKLKTELTAIQRGELPDPHGWVTRLA